MQNEALVKSKTKHWLDMKHQQEAKRPPIHEQNQQKTMQCNSQSKDTDDHGKSQPQEPIWRAPTMQILQQGRRNPRAHPHWVHPSTPKRTKVRVPEPIPRSRPGEAKNSSRPHHGPWEEDWRSHLTMKQGEDWLQQTPKISYSNGYQNHVENERM